MCSFSKAVVGRSFYWVAIRTMELLSCRDCIHAENGIFDEFFYNYFHMLIKIRMKKGAQSCSISIEMKMSFIFDQHVFSPMP